MRPSSSDWQTRKRPRSRPYQRVEQTSAQLRHAEAAASKAQAFRDHERQFAMATYGYIPNAAGGPEIPKSNERLPPMPRDPNSIDVFYATNRAPAGSSYGSEESPDLRYGFSTVKISETRKSFFSGVSALRLVVGGDPDLVRNFTLSNVQQLAYTDFKRMFRRRVRETDTRSVLIFVHGFNVSFDDAIIRTGQIAADLDTDAVPFAFTWPARNDFAFETVKRLLNIPLCWRHAGEDGHELHTR